jgi:hypothetical protein
MLRGGVHGGGDESESESFASKQKALAAATWAAQNSLFCLT